MHQTSVYIGTIAGGFFAGLIGQHYGWRWSFVVFGGAGILLGFVLSRWLREPKRVMAATLPINETVRAIIGQPGALALLGAFFCANFVAVVLLTWMPTFLFDRFHMSLAMSGLTATIYVQLASMVGAVCGGWLADLWRAKHLGGRMLVQALGVFGGAPFVVLCGMTRSLAWLIVALTVWGFFKGLYHANIFASVLT